MDRFKPLSPDPFIIEGEDMALAKFGHLNALVDELNQVVPSTIGLMYQSLYDPLGTGVVNDSRLFNGQNPAYYLDRTNHTGTQPISTIAGLQTALNNSGDMFKALYDTNDDGVVNDSSLLEGQAGAYYLDRNNHTGTQAQSTITNLVSDLADKIDVSEKGANNGVAELDGSGQVPLSQLPISSLSYKGVWDANSNTPTITGGVGTTGDFYWVTVAGTTSIDGIASWAIGDAIIYDGIAWQKAFLTAGVTSINGLTGVVTIDTDDIAATATNSYVTAVLLAGLNASPTPINISNPAASQADITAVNNAIAAKGDMLRSVYDQNLNGIVDNSELLEGQPGSYYLDRTNHTGVQPQSTVANLTADLASKIPYSEKGQPNGVCDLDSNGLVPVSRLNLSALNFQNTWNASTNSPFLQDGTGTSGHAYIVSVAGTNVNLGSGVENYDVGDLIVHNGSTWNKVPNTVGTGIQEINGFTTAVVSLTTDDVPEGIVNFYMSSNQHSAFNAANAPGATNPLATIDDLDPLNTAIAANAACCSSNTAALAGKEDKVNKGVALGYVPLDAGGKIDPSFLNFSAFNYQNSWDANTNTPTLADGVGTAGQAYIVGVAGTIDLGSGSTAYVVGDLVIYNGTIWEKVAGAVAGVSSVNGFTGAVTLDADNIAETATRFWLTSAQNDAIDAAELAGADGVNRLATLADITGTLPVHDQALFVSKGGDDGTAEPYNANKPYLTVDAAYAAAVAGDTIVVLPGNYELSAALELDNRNISFEFVGKGLLQLDVAVQDFLFTDVPSASATDCVINGPGWTFEARGYDGGAPMTNGVLDVHKASKIIFIADQIISEDSALCLEGAESGGAYTVTPEIRVKANYITTTLNDRQGPIYAQIGVSLYVDAGEVDCTLRANYDGAPIYTDLCPYVNINIDRVINKGVSGSGLRMADSLPGDIYYANVDYLQSQEGWTIYMEGQSTDVYITGQRLVSASDCCLVATGTTAQFEGFLVEATIGAAGTDGIIHAENGGTIYAKNLTLTRDASTPDGYDIITSGVGAQVFLQSTSYDPTKVWRIFAGNIYEWNGANYVETPIITNQPAGVSGNTIQNSIAFGGTINFNSNAGSVIDNCILLNTDLTFSTPTTIQNEIWINNILMSPPNIEAHDYGSTVTVTRPVELKIGESGSGSVTINLPTAGVAAGNYVIVSDYGADSNTNPIIIDSGVSNVISGRVFGQSYVMNSNGQTVRFKLLDDTPGSFQWKAELSDISSGASNNPFVSPEDYGAIHSNQTFADLGISQPTIDATYPGIGALTTDTVDWAAVQYAMDRAVALGKYLATNGIYYVNRGVQFYTDTYSSRLRWEGGGCKFITTNTNVFNVITIGIQPTQHQSGPLVPSDAMWQVNNTYNISSIQIECNENQIGLWAWPSYTSTFMGISVRNPGSTALGGVGFTFVFNLEATISNCKVEDVDYSFRVRSGNTSGGDILWTGATTSNSQCNHTIFNNCRISWQGDPLHANAGFDIIDASGVGIYDSVIEGTRVKKGISLVSELTTVLTFSTRNMHYECSLGTQDAGNDEAFFYARTLGGHYHLDQIYSQYDSIMTDTGISSGPGSSTVRLSNNRYWLAKTGKTFENKGNTTYIIEYCEEPFFATGSIPGLVNNVAVTLCGGPGCGNNKYSHVAIPR